MRLDALVSVAGRTQTLPATTTHGRRSGHRFTYLEYEGLDHSASSLGDSSDSGRRVAQEIADLLSRQRTEG